ncbi:MAG: hypothetical protein Q9163_005762 [Psora crenata]
MDDLSISLQVPSSIEGQKNSLQSLIGRIVEQKGSFRNVTEEGLKEEIKDAAEGDTVMVEEDATLTGEEPQDFKSKKDEIYKARDEMLKQIGCAQQESAMALDFISLLLSERTPGNAALTLSPFLKQTLPVGSLGAELVQSPDAAQAERQYDEMLAMGWRVESLNKAADSLLDSASRLEGEMRKEATYWGQVLAIKEKGWSLSRLPREKHTLGVRYGYAEAYSNFRDRGLAALRQDEEGNLNLDCGHRSSSKRRLRVRILLDGVPISTASDHPDADPQSGSLEQEILDSRNGIFDEELDLELHREAEHLANQGVCRVDNGILIPYEEGKHIEIALVPKECIEDRQTSKDANTADVVALSLRILLSQAHQDNLQYRSQRPAPIREGERPRPVYAILKPIIQVLQHRSHVASVYGLLNDYRKSLIKAGLPLSIEATTLSLEPMIGFSEAVKLRSSRSHALTNFVTALSSVKITIYALDQLTPATIHVKTIISPSVGTTYSIRDIFSKADDVVCTSLPELERGVSHLLLERIKRYIPATIGAWRDAEVGVMILTKFNTALSRRETLSLALERKSLSLFLRTSDSVERTNTWIWYAEESVPTEPKRLQEVLSDV